MTVKLYRIDDRLIHGQVVVGWGQPMHVGFIALVDDGVRANEWEQDLYRMSVPQHIEVIFASVAEAADRLSAWEDDRRPGIVVAGDVGAFAHLARRSRRLTRINIGGLHPRADRAERLRYVYLSDAEAAQLKELAAGGVEITAQDVPSARAVPLVEFT